MPARSSNRSVVAVAILIAVGAALYLLSGGLMDWLRVTIHGR